MITSRSPGPSASAPPASDHVTHLYRVCWTSLVSDSHGQGRPMVKELAEFVAHDEALAQPMRRFWIEACADVPTDQDEPPGRR